MSEQTCECGHRTDRHEDGECAQCDCPVVAPVSEQNLCWDALFVVVGDLATDEPVVKLCDQPADHDPPHETDGWKWSQ